MNIIIGFAVSLAAFYVLACLVALARDIIDNWRKR